MEFRYRQVGYGTRFRGANGERSSASTAGPDELFENECAVDVGGICSGNDEVSEFVFDHHFYRAAGQYPSAAAAVLHNAERIYSHFARRPEILWLVTHREPDFDAFCAMYLVRSILTDAIPASDWPRYGLRSDGWFRSQKEIDWFQPHVSDLPDDRRWPVLLAAFAAYVDNCRPVACKINRALHSILYAALQRGRNYYSETNGALEFFDEVQAALKLNRLHPAFDSVLEGSVTFAPELDLLDREIDAYQRDLHRARRSIVYVLKSKGEFQTWFPTVQAAPLLGLQGELAANHLELVDHSREQADGIFIRDPECLLFKEWARNDIENSSMGRGFLFTAVAYSDQRSGETENRTAYYFALDPERAQNRHLYDAWAKLQQREVAKLTTKGGPPRTGFERRAGYDPASGTTGPFTNHFDDPWFDGHNYNCSIIVTPNKGTVLGCGIAGDLSDDEVANVVRDTLESSFFVGTEERQEFQVATSVLSSVLDAANPTRKSSAPASQWKDGYRFYSIKLDPGVDLLTGDIASQIGSTLWGRLNPEDGTGVPSDFHQRHLIHNQFWIAVWNRRGMAVAYHSHAENAVTVFRSLMDNIARLSLGSQKLANQARSLLEFEQAQTHSADGVGHKVASIDNRSTWESEVKGVLHEGEALMLQVADVKRSLAAPDHRVVARFFEASKLDEVIDSVRDLYLAASERWQAAKLDENTREVAEVQNKVEWVEMFIVSVYAVELLHKVGEGLDFSHSYMAWGLLSVALFTILIAYALLKPDHHRKLKLRNVLSAVSLCLLVVVGFILFGFNFKTNETNSVRPPGSDVATPHEPAGPTPKH